MTSAASPQTPRATAPLGPIGHAGEAGKGIVWVTSYPKSGNTWVGTLLYSYAMGAPERNGEEKKLIVPHTRVLSDLRNDRMNERDAFRTLRRAGSKVDKPAGWENLTFVKTHCTAGSSRPLLRRTAGAIVIVRRPKDVFLSSVNFLTMRGKLSGTPQDLARSFIETGGAPIWRDAGYGTWRSQWVSWLSQTSGPVLLVTYEDLKADPAWELTRMVEFLGGRVDAGRVTAAVDASEFSKMKARAEKNPKATPNAPNVFFNAGTAGRSLADVPEYELAGFDAAFDARFDKEFAAFQSIARERHRPLI